MGINGEKLLFVPLKDSTANLLFATAFLYRFSATPPVDPEPLYKSCTYHNVLFSTNMAYFLLECLGPGIPIVTLYATRHQDFSNITVPIPKPLLVLQNNTKLYVSNNLKNMVHVKYIYTYDYRDYLMFCVCAQERVSTLALPVIKTFPVIISGGNTAQVRIYLPPVLQEQEITRYPLVLQV